MKGFIDMHIHTINSDGKYTCEEILNEAEQLNTEIISITDHDRLSGYNELKKLSFKSDIIKIIPGAELSTDFYLGERKVRVHLLCYGVINNNGELAKELRKIKLAREIGNIMYINMLIKKLPFIEEKDFIGFDFSRYGWIKKLILSHLSLDRFTEDEQRILMRCLDEIKPIYPDKCTLEIADAIGLVKQENGYSSFAHPHETRLSELELRQTIKRFKEMGLDSVETFHANATREENELANRIATENMLLQSCGSDYHFHKEDNGIKNIGLGVNGNMCITQISLADELLRKKKFFFQGKYQEEKEL